jgi:protein required for attachment to host cells
MPRICIVVADAARARLYTYEPGDYPVTERRAELVERADLVNPERRLRPSEVLSDRPGLSRAPTGVLHGMGDHRVRREHDVDLRFAGEIYRQLDDLLTAHPAPRVVVVASPNMLGLLRQWTGGLGARSIQLDEVAADLTRETTPVLHDHLAKLSLIPARQRLMVSS